MSKTRLFFMSAAVTFAAFLVYAAMTRYRPDQSVNSHALLDNVFVTDQVTLAAVDALPGKGYRSLVDLRPDGEAADQPASTAVGDAARKAGLTFAYIPTPHGDIPNQVVADLARTLEAAPKPVIMYCRSGKRASRVWALAEASRPGGATASQIAAAVRTAGQPIDDLLAQIDTRIAARTSQTIAKEPL